MRTAQDTHTNASRRGRRGGALVLTLAVGLIGTLATAPAAQAAEPPYLGADGSSLIQRDETMVPAETGPQGALEPVANNDFYAALWTGSNSVSQTAVFRYFEHPRGEAGADPVRIETNTAESGLLGKVHSISTDADGRLYTLHRDPSVASPNESFQVTQWAPDGTNPVTKSVEIPGAPQARILGIAVSGSGDNVSVTYRVDNASGGTASGIWRGAWGAAPAQLNQQPIAPSPNPFQSPFIDLGTLADGTEAVYFQIAPAQLGILIDGQVVPAPDLRGAAVSNDDFVEQTDTANSGITWDDPTAPRAPQQLHGIDARQVGAGDELLYVSAGWTLYGLDPKTGVEKTRVLQFGNINFFTFYQSRFGTDGRLYLSGFGPWGLLPVDAMTLKSPTLEYAQGLSANICAAVPGEPVTVEPSLVTGNPGAQLVHRGRRSP